MFTCMFVCLYVCLEFRRGQILVYWHVMGDTSDIKRCDRRTSELSNAPLHIKQDTTSIEKILYNSITL